MRTARVITNNGWREVPVLAWSKSGLFVHASVGPAVTFGMFVVSAAPSGRCLPNATFKTLAAAKQVVRDLKGVVAWRSMTAARAARAKRVGKVIHAAILRAHESEAGA